jgi:hypothetical protein
MAEVLHLGYRCGLQLYSSRAAPSSPKAPARPSEAPLRLGRHGLRGAQPPNSGGVRRER